MCLCALSPIKLVAPRRWGWLPNRMVPGRTKGRTTRRTRTQATNPIIRKLHGSLIVRVAPKAIELLRHRELSRVEWTGRAPAPNGSESAPGLVRIRSTTMPRSTYVGFEIAVKDKG